MHLRLSTRLILAVVITQSIMIFALVWNSVRLTEESNARLLQQSIESETRLLTSSLAPGLAFNDRATLEDVISLLKEKKNLVYIAVYNSDDERMVGHGNFVVAKRDHTYQEALTDHIYDSVADINVAGQYLGRVYVGYSIDFVRDIVAKARNQNAAIGIIFLIISASVTIMIGLLMTRNLRKLEDATHALKSGQLDYRVDAESNDEIGDLARSFNQMAAHLNRTEKELREERKALRRESAFMETLLNNINAVVVEAKPPGYQYTYVSQEAENLLGFPSEQWLKENFWYNNVYRDDRSWVLKSVEENTHKSGSFSLDFRMVHKNGGVIWVRSINNVEINEVGDVIMRGLVLDIMEQKTAEDRILFLAEHDSLTGLINRRRFQEELDRAVAYSQRYQQQGALLFIDLDQFKYINDSYGHQYGDEYLVDVSRRLSKALRKTDILGRLGGDEFGVIIPNVTLEEVKTVATALLGTLSQETIKYKDKVIHISASIGVVFFPTQGEIGSDLLAKADAAMYNAKHSGRSQYHIFSEDDDELWNMQAKVHWEERIRWALKENRFTLYFQPVADLKSYKITHYEVLLRMIGSDDELILPAAFLDTAERFGLIREIDCWVLQNAIKEQAARRDASNEVALAINISGRHFGSSDIMTVVKESMDTYGVDPSKIVFEITETAAVENLSEAREFIDSLQSIGCRFALDDFGTGFSSFHYLRNLPVDYVKIDGSFVRNLHIDQEDRVFVKAMVELAQGLGITCIAEFVENREIVGILRNLGVELGQGYYLSKPKPDTLDSDVLELQ